MPDPNNPNPWTPDYAWKLVDQVLIMAKVSEISREMQAKMQKAKATAHFEGMQKGNGAYYPAERIRREEDGADEWAGKLYRAALEVLQTQGHTASRPFFQAIYAYLLVPLFAARNGTVSSDLRLTDVRAGNVGRCQPHMQSFSRAMTRLKSKWATKMEVAAREHEYAQERKRRLKAERLEATGGRGDNASDAVVLPKRKPARRSKTQERRRQVIFGILQMGFRGIAYCKALDHQGLATPEKWQSDGCPRKYASAYQDPHWRQRVQYEKSNFARAYESCSSRQKDRIIAGENS